MSPQDLDPHAVVSWLRTQARNFTRAADDIERAFKLGQSTKVGPSGAVSVPGHVNELPSVARVKEIVGNRRVRAASLAAEMGVDPERLSAILTPENGFLKGDRGWIYLDDDSATATDEN